MTRVYIIAGEPSGDQLGGHLMAALRAERPGIEIRGIGGDMMAEQGLQSLFPMSDLSVMGLAEVLPRLPKLLRRVREAAEDVIARKPDVLITIDSPDFCLRVAKRVRKAMPGVKTVHYVAPSVWAWRPERAEKMARHIDHVLALLPFEPPYMERAGMSCDFVGHPVARLPRIDAQEAAQFRAEIGVAPKASMICLLPGSRAGEVSRQAATYLDAVAQIREARPNCAVVIPAAAPVADLVAEITKGVTPAPIILDPREMDADAAQRRKFAAFAASDVAIAASGTVSLELARQATPMVIGYQMNALTRWIVKRKFLLDTATLVNIVADTRIIPEFIFEQFQPDKIATAALTLLNDPTARMAQVEACNLTMSRLGADDGTPPGQGAARSVLGFIDAKT